MALMTYAEAIAEIRSDFDESVAAQVTDIELRRWINRGVQKAARMTECLRETTTKAITGGTADYVMSGLTDDIIRFHTACFVVTGDTTEYWLQYKDLMSGQQDWGTGRRQVSGMPAAFWTWDHPPTLAVSLYPTPSESGTLTIYFYREAQRRLTDGTQDALSVDLPSGWEETAVLYARYRAFKKDGQVEQAQLELQEWNDNLQALSSAATRFTDQPGCEGGTVLSASGHQRMEHRRWM